MKTHASNPPPQCLLTKSEAAKLLNISTRTLDDWRSSGAIACIQRPNFVRFLLSDLEAFIQRHRRPENQHRSFRRRPRQQPLEQPMNTNMEGMETL
jgi:hypothetical protein